MSYFFSLILAIVLPSLRISPLLNRTWLVAMAAIVLFHTATLSFSVVYIQSIGSGMGFFSELFTNFLFTKSSIGLEEISLLLFSLVPVKPKRLTAAERSQFTLTDDLKDILVGLILGDLNVQKQTKNSNAILCFEQGFVHKDYLFHLYNLFEIYCSKAPTTANRLPDKRTGNVYTRIYFKTMALPCFNYYYDLFYPKGVKRVPENIADLLTPLGLAMWICDDGKFVASGGLSLCTNSYNDKDVSILMDVLTTRFGLICTIHITQPGAKVIHISKKSMDKLRSIVKPHMIPSMLYKIHL